MERDRLDAKMRRIVNVRMVTFIAGVYGMNFTHIPELGWKYAYPVFWFTCGSIIVGLLVYFRRKGWI